MSVLPALPEPGPRTIEPDLHDPSSFPLFRTILKRDGSREAFDSGRIERAIALAGRATVREFVRSVCAGYSLPYFTLMPTFSICPAHGYLAGEQPACPECGEATEVYSRVVGYLRPVRQWNRGKQQEFARRALLDGRLGKATSGSGGQHHGRE